MKDPHPFPSETPPEEAFVDAALREHARLGTAGRDSDLIRSILLATVEKPKTGSAPAPGNRGDRKLWIAGLSAAAAILALLATLLALLPFRSGSRDAEEIRFLVQYAPPVETESASAFSSAPVPQEPAPFTGEIKIEISKPGLVPEPLRVGDLSPLDIPFTPSFSDLPAPHIREHRLQIIADRTREFDGRRLYEGNVEVRHQNFILNSERVELFGGGGEDPPAPVRLLAANATLQQISPGRTALAGQLEYEPATNRFSLLDVVFLESSQGRLHSFTPTDRVYLTGENLSIQKASGAGPGHTPIPE